MLLLELLRVRRLATRGWAAPAPGVAVPSSFACGGTVLRRRGLTVRLPLLLLLHIMLFLGFPLGGGVSPRTCSPAPARGPPVLARVRVEPIFLLGRRSRSRRPLLPPLSLVVVRAPNRRLISVLPPPFHLIHPSTPAAPPAPRSPETRRGSVRCPPRRRLVPGVFIAHSPLGWHRLAGGADAVAAATTPTPPISDGGVRARSDPATCAAASVKAVAR